MANVSLRRKKKLSVFRRIAIGTWRTPYEAQVYGTLQVRMDRAMEFLERYRAETGKRLTVTHMVAKAAAAALVEMPDAAAIMRFGRIYLRDRIDIFLQVVLTDEGEGKVDLSGVTLREVDKKSLGEIIDAMEERVESARAREKKGVEKTRSVLRWVPLWLIGTVLRFTAFLGYTLNLRLPGVPRDPFGALMITNIGSLGLEHGYVPLVSYSRVPMILAIGAVREVPVVDAGRIGVGKVMNINCTFDHRFIDGYHAAVMSRTLRRWLEDPDEHFSEPSP
jgi:pyruvate dehydrogenase E2 component (dihydrolipoamide acetyltransferase)